MIDLAAMKEIASTALKENWYKDVPTEKLGTYQVEALDKPMYQALAESPESKSLTDVSDERKQELKEQGYGDKVIESVRSEEEMAIYEDAKLQPQEINGRECLVRTDIDYNQLDDRGRTNLERMEKGLSPLDQDGQSYELHHVGQKMDAPLAELSKQEHTGGGNHTILHDVKAESEISRAEFGKERAEHWKARAEEIKQEVQNT